MLKVLSLGAGVQSSTMALMSAKGELPKVDGAIFADTQAEPPSVYEWLDWLEAQLPYPVWRVTKGNLGEDALVVRRSKKSGKLYQKGLLPVFVKNEDGSKGKLWRTCTMDYKISPIVRKCRELNPDKSRMESWIGISTDEAIRMKESRHPWIVHKWPLIDMGISRQDCKTWMTDHGYPEPPRSACYFCPYHGDAEWLRLKVEEPEVFGMAVDYERRFRETSRSKQEVLRGEPFFHNSLLELGVVEFDGEGQLDLFGEECEGMCGV